MIAGQVTACLAGGGLGAVAGSFLTTAAMRGRARGFALAGRSACDHCGAALGAWDTLPLVSFATLGGRCRRCSGPIAMAHPLGELAGLTAGASIVGLWPPEAWAGLSVLAGGLIFLAVNDARTLRIPDAATAAVAAAGLGLAWAADAWLVNLAAAVAVLAALLALRALFGRLRGEPGLGLGDVKLIAALTLWAGPVLTPWAIVAAAGSALVWTRWARLGHGERAPFGPFIALGFWVVAGLWGAR